MCHQGRRTPTRCQQRRQARCQQRRQNVLGLQAGFAPQQHLYSTYERRQGPLGLLVGLIVAKVQEKKYVKEKALVEIERERSGEQVIGVVGGEREEVVRESERRDVEGEKEGGYLGDNWREGPPAYEKVARE